MPAQTVNLAPAVHPRLWAGLRACGSDIALHDVVLCTFHAYLFIRASFAPASAAQLFLCVATFGLFALTCGAVAQQRRAWIAHAWLRELLYRAGITLPLIGAYLLLRQLLPALGVPLADAALLRLDERILGVTPALWLERFATDAAVEWFSFFYYSYYLLLGTHLVLALWRAPGERSRRLLLGLVLVTTIGHALYTLVPGVGPYAYSQLGFTRALHGGAFFARVQSAVTQAGAQLDIFPSLHTAHPLFIALHALHHRGSRLYRFSWPIIVFAALNMIVSTMFLRFHYAIDVAAGIALACAAHAVTLRAQPGLSSPRSCSRSCPPGS